MLDGPSIRTGGKAVWTGLRQVDRPETEREQIWTAEGQMRRVAVAVVVALAVAGCAHGLVGQLPAVTDAENAAVVVFIREARFAGAGVSVPVGIDGRKVYALRVGEHVAIKVSPGDRVVGVRYLGFTFHDEEITQALSAEARRTDYVRIDPGYGGFLLGSSGNRVG